MMRMTRAALINLLASPYMEMAQLKGVPRREAIVKHALPNAWAPIATVIAFNLAYLVVGVVVVEVVFVYPGIGQLMVDSVSSRNMPVVQACALIFAATYILLNLSADIISIITNPRLAASQMTAQAPDIRNVRARRTFLQNAKRTLATAPISAWFGMIVIVIYVIAAIFAPLDRALWRGGGRRQGLSAVRARILARHRPDRPRPVLPPHLRRAQHDRHRLRHDAPVLRDRRHAGRA